MKKARQLADKLRGKNPSEKEFDEDEKMVDKHLSHDIEESNMSIKDDKKLKKYLRKGD